MATNVLVVGSGGREHALAWKLAQSPRIGKLYIAPGNGGTRSVGENAPIAASDIDGLKSFAKKQKVDLTVVGPDDVLALGIVDAFQGVGLRIFGPTKAAAQIESSKAFAKQLMHDSKIPTAAYRIFTNYEAALGYARVAGAPIVIKASGLAQGKGVSVCNTIAEIEEALKRIMVDRVYGDSGKEVIIEEYLKGLEISIHALSDGFSFLMFPPSQDHKAALDDDLGKNTGGMGAIVPLPWLTPEVTHHIQNKIVGEALESMARGGNKFSGLLFPGVILTTEGPKVLEFNARFGDPETQAYMRLLKSDLLDLLEACTDFSLAVAKEEIEWNRGFAVNVVLASAGYPDAYKKGFAITGIEEAEKIPGVVVFHAGTQFNLSAQTGGELVTSGGRVIGVSAFGMTLESALESAYKAVDLIHFEGKQFRRDIGAKALRYYTSLRV